MKITICKYNNNRSTEEYIKLLKQCVQKIYLRQCTVYNLYAQIRRQPLQRKHLSACSKANTMPMPP